MKAAMLIRGFAAVAVGVKEEVEQFQHAEASGITEHPDEGAVCEGRSSVVNRIEEACKPAAKGVLHAIMPKKCTNNKQKLKRLQSETATDNMTTQRM